MRVAHTERLILATVNVKSLKPKEFSRSHKYRVDTNSTILQIDRDVSLHRCHVVGVRESWIEGYVTREQQNLWIRQVARMEDVSSVSRPGYTVLC